MTVLPVLVQNWQMECCGRPFSIGDQVSWRLELSIGDLDLPEDALSELDWTATTIGRQNGSWVLLDAGPVRGSLVRPHPEVAQGAVHLRGLLTAHWHGPAPDVPRTAGTVRRIRVLRRRRTIGSDAVDTVEAVELVDVPTCPKWFSWHRPRSGPATYWTEDGAVVDVEVTGSDGTAGSDEKDQVS